MNGQNEKHFPKEIEYESVWVIVSTNRSSLWEVLWKVSVLGILEHNK